MITLIAGTKQLEQQLVTSHKFTRGVAQLVLSAAWSDSLVLDDALTGINRFDTAQTAFKRFWLIRGTVPQQGGNDNFKLQFLIYFYRIKYAEFNWWVSLLFK